MKIKVSQVQSLHESKPSFKLYKQFIDSHPEIPIYFQPWWLNIVFGQENWTSALAFDRSGAVAGVWPFKVSRYWNMKIIQKPELTHFLGPWIVYPEQLSPSQKRAFENNILNQLIDQLPETAYLNVYCPYDFHNWQPFYWRGFRQTTFYADQFPSFEHEIEAFHHLRKDVRKKIKKAQATLVLEETNQPELLYRLIQNSFQKRSKKPSYSKFTLINLANTLIVKGQGKMFFAKTENSEIAGGSVFMWDRRAHYSLVFGGNPALQSTGVFQLLMWTGIRHAVSHGHPFNFCGSMIKSVSAANQAFNTSQIPYFRLLKTKHIGFRLIFELFRRI